MKITLHLLLFLLPLSLYAQKKSDSVRVQELINKNLSDTLTNEEQNEVRSYGYKIQNEAFILEEQSHDYRGALARTDDAISFWKSINDRASEANLRKYKGMLLGHLSQFEEGKSEINKAIRLYEALDLDYGVAVSKYDMSRLLDLEGKIDSALVYQSEATQFWKNKKDTTRIIINNTQLIHLYGKKRLFQEAENIQMANERLITPEKHWNPRINFYYVSYKLFTALKDRSKADQYKELYTSELQTLKRKNINIKSIYDED